MTMGDSTSPGETRFGFGRVIAGTFNAIGRNFALFLGLAALAAITSEALFLFQEQPANFSRSAILLLHFAKGEPLTAGDAVLYALKFAGTLFSTFVTAALLYAAASSLDGNRTSLAEAIDAAMRAIVPLLVITILWMFFEEAWSTVSATLGPEIFGGLRVDDFPIGEWLYGAIIIVLQILFGLVWALAIASAVMDRSSVAGLPRSINHLSAGKILGAMSLTLLYSVVIGAMNITLFVLVPPHFEFHLVNGHLPPPTYPPYASEARIAVWIFEAMLAGAGIGALYRELRGTAGVDSSAAAQAQ